jgi:hypothetical protein
VLSTHDLVRRMNSLSVIEPVLLAAAICALVRARAYKPFSAFGNYLAFGLGLFILSALVIPASRLGFVEVQRTAELSLYIHWIGSLVAACLLFLVIQQVFGHLMEPLSGLGRLGLVAFRWVTLTSVLVAVALSVLPFNPNKNLLVAVTGGITRCMSVLELGLLAFIILSRRTLPISVRRRDVGVVLGLALIGGADLLQSVFSFWHSTMASVANYSGGVAICLAICIWTTYFLLPEPESKALTLRATSPLLRWNEVAKALGEPPPQIALGKSGDFFLQDVEKAVDRILQRNSVDTGN